jgi:hypothetical protein
MYIEEQQYNDDILVNEIGVSDRNGRPTPCNLINNCSWPPQAGLLQKYGLNLT